MPLYHCELCKFTTPLKSNYSNHLTTMKHIGKSKSEVSIAVSQNKSHECKYCGQKYKHKQSVVNHIKYSCTKNKDEDMKELVRVLNLQLEAQRSQIQNQEKRLTKYEKQIEKLTSKLEIHGSFNTVNNITLLGYRETDVSHLTDADYRYCIKRVNHSVKTLVDKIHFNKLKPENMNLYISNMKDKYMSIYDGSNWTLVHKKEELERLYEEKEMMLEEWLDSNPSEELKDKFLKYLNNKEDDECLNQIKEDFKLMIYNRTREMTV